jgi:hypothetical protein
MGDPFIESLNKINSPRTEPQKLSMKKLEGELEEF